MAYSSAQGAVMHLECNVDSPLQRHAHWQTRRQGWEKNRGISSGEPKWRANGLPLLEVLLFSLVE